MISNFSIPRTTLTRLTDPKKLARKLNLVAGPSTLLDRHQERYTNTQEIFCKLFYILAYYISFVFVDSKFTSVVLVPEETFAV